MNFSKHCDLCENEITSLEKGLTCKLTKRKPNFEITCPKIKLGKKFQEKLEITNLELERIRRNKTSSHINFYFLITIGFVLIIGGNYFFKSTIESVYSLEISLGIISIGVSLLGVAYAKFNGFRRKLKNAEFDKNEIDEFFKKYGIEYKTSFCFKEEIHGIQEVIVKLEYKNWRRKQTTTTYKVNWEMINNTNSTRYFKPLQRDSNFETTDIDRLW